VRSVVIGLMLTGLLVLFCCALFSFSWRKEGVSAGELWMAGSKAASQPERYFRPDRVGVVRALNYVGVGLLLAGVLIMVAATLGGAR
jgi:hypothetical protein